MNEDNLEITFDDNSEIILVRLAHHYHGKNVYTSFSASRDEVPLQLHALQQGDATIIPQVVEQLRSYESAHILNQREQGLLTGLLKVLDGTGRDSPTRAHLVAEGISLSEDREDISAPENISGLESSDLSDVFHEDPYEFSCGDAQQCVSFKLIGPAGIECIVLEEIENWQRGCKKFLGTALGIDVSHCVYLGAKHNEDFLRRARWYFVSEEDEDGSLRLVRCRQTGTIKVEFYGDFQEAVCEDPGEDERIALKDLKEYGEEFIGTVFDLDVYRYIRLGAQHSRDFLRRVRGYFVSEENDEENLSGCAGDKQERPMSNCMENPWWFA